MILKIKLKKTTLEKKTSKQRFYETQRFLEVCKKTTKKKSINYKDFFERKKDDFKNND